MTVRFHRLVSHPALAIAGTLLAGLFECWALLRAGTTRRRRA
ncbi:hypothetical protein [Pseudaquabacterium terrae]|nr:hypothetical protein [Aquabacterium terrae]